MRNRQLLICIAALVAVVSPAPVVAGVITFDPFPSIPADVTVEYFSGGLAGPLAALPAPLAVALVSDSSAVPGGGNALRVWNTASAFGPYGVLLTFASLQATVSAIGNDFGGDSLADNETVHLTAFDSAGAVIGFSSFSSAFATPNLKPVSFAGSGIKYAALTWQNDLGFYMFDNVEYTPDAIPEPGTIVLLGSGITGLALRRRRRNG